jgi:ferrous iron transport protein B
LSIGKLEQKKLVVALAGNANVGKSVIFNELTGLHQHVGNWPGKTVERAEGTLTFQGYTIDVIDLPGIYSLSAYSIEERISREFIAIQQPDVIINVIDASALERNLFFTLQLLELQPRIVIALNQIDMAENKGIKIETKQLSHLTNVPVVPTIAVKGIGLEELMKVVVDTAHEERSPKKILYGSEIEERIDVLTKKLVDLETSYPKRWIAIKLLEGDDEIIKTVYHSDPKLENLVEKIKAEIEEIHNHDIFSVIASERYAVANRISIESTTHIEPRKTVSGMLEDLTSHHIFGYLIMILVLATMFYSIFTIGDYSAGLLDAIFSELQKIYYSNFGEGIISNFVWKGFIGGLVAGITVAIPYIVPFYVAMSLLEDSGYLARIAFLMDSVMHRIGLHGKGFIPMMLGFGCNVPACLGCRIMETERERLICAFLASLVPCAARSVVIMGLVAEYLGFEWAAVLYLIDFILIFILGRIAFRVVPGESMGFIMEIPSYRKPSIKTTAQRTWIRLQGFVYEAFPIIIIGNLIVQLSDVFGWLNIAQNLLKPVTVYWLGLPAVSGVILIFGILRKELTLILLASLLGTSNFASILSPVQMFVFAFVVMVYVPCIATISVLVKEFGYKIALIIAFLEIALALVLGGFIFRVLNIL